MPHRNYEHHEVLGVMPNRLMSNEQVPILADGLPGLDRNRRTVYVAGPISKGDIADNIDRARAAAREIMHVGLAPYVPQLSVFLEGNVAKTNPWDFPHAVWLACCKPWVEASDFLLRLPGESKGADMEVQWAIAKCIPVAFSLTQLRQLAGV